MEIKWREKILERLGSEEFDVVVIGGGINGAGIARDASLRGLSVALIEKGDFAEGTSSRSSKLVHGGLRYLKNREFLLVREATTERKTLLKIAGHNVRRIPFLVPIFTWSKEGKLKLRLGLTLYDILAFPKNIGWHKMLNKKKIIEKEPILDTSDLKSGALYYDCQMNDARLCLENIQTAERQGAVILNYCEAKDFIYDENGKIVGVVAEDQLTGKRGRIYGKIVINTAGPWADQVRRLSGEQTKRLRTTKGIHLIVPKILNDHAVILFLKDGRAVFLIPWYQYTLIGTTDTDFEGNPDEVGVTLDDVNYLLENIKDAFPKFDITHDQIISAYAGLRPLVREEGKSESEVSREHKIFEDPDGLITLIGGKYTTYRTMAKEIVDLVVKRLGLKGKMFECDTDKFPLIGGEFSSLEELQQELKRLTKLSDDLYIDHLIRTYGSEAMRLIAFARHYQLKFEPIKEGLPFLWPEIDWAVKEEYACRLTDIMWRRTYLALTPNQGIDAMEAIAQRMAELLGWSREEKSKEIQHYLNTLELVNQWRTELNQKK